MMAVTAPFLIRHTKVGLEFQGGYEILYKASPKTPGSPVTHATLLETAQLLEKYANAMGVSEPDVRLEGTDQIRVKLAGVSSNDQVRKMMQTGQLPLNITEKYSQTVGGVLGMADLHDTLLAGTIALAIIIGFLLLVYRAPGAVAGFTLVFSLWLLLVAFSTLHATLSIAAIVAFVLGFGILSGANILTFERIKEESHRHDAAWALRKGHKVSFRTILDSSASVLIAAIILFVAGIGPIRGFALTLMLSVAVSIIGSVLLTRFLLYLIADEKRLRHTLFFTPNRAVSSSGFDFVKHGGKFLAASLLIAAVGGVSLVRGQLNYDIDFKAGTALDVIIPKTITQDEATDIMTKAGVPPATVAIGGVKQNQVAARFDNVLKSDQLGQVISAFKSVFGSTVAYQENTADPAVARSLAQQAIYAIAFAIVGLFAFVSLRFGWRFATATTVALLNATFFVLTVFSLFHLEIDVTFIAAILTVMGYTINDTVIVFDRVLENLKRGKMTGSLADIANMSIHQTLKRAIYTVLTVVTGSICLYFFGAEPLQMFSLAILMGLLCATFSSIFLAVPVWYRLSRHQHLVQDVAA
ncbi:MAG: protein translocase subunit SecF [Burkholderiales bacterium]